MGHAGHQATGLGGVGKVFGRCLGTVVKLVHGLACTHRDGALVQVEDLLEAWAHDGAGQVALRFLRSSIFQLEQDERVHVEGERIGRTGRCGAHEVLAGGLACGNELTLGPVTHQLKTCLALDEHGRGQVPVAAWGARVGVGLDAAEGFQRLLHGVAGQGLVVQLHQRVLVKLGATHAQHHGFEGGEVLPVLAAVCDWDQARSLELVSSGKELVPGLGHGGNAGLLQRIRAGPDPVHAVHVDRGGHIVALVLHHIGHDLGQRLVPFLGLGQGVHVAQHTFRCPLLNGGALDLCGRWGVARNHAALEHRHGAVAAAAGHGKVTPGVALGLHHLLELRSRLGFPAGSPVVQHLHLTRMCSHCCCQGSRHSGDFCQFPHIPCLLVVGLRRCTTGLLRSAQPVL